MGPMLVLPMLYVAYFFPARYAWPLAVLEVADLRLAAGHLATGRTTCCSSARSPTPSPTPAWSLTIQFLKRRLVAAERHQHRMARVDPLTGLENRRAFDEALDARPGARHRFTLLLADVDSFKQINDRFGHTTGDRVLRELAAHASASRPRRRLPRPHRRRRVRLVAPGAGSRGRRPPRRRAARGRR